MQDAQRLTEAVAMRSRWSSSPRPIVLFLLLCKFVGFEIPIHPPLQTSAFSSGSSDLCTSCCDESGDRISFLIFVSESTTKMLDGQDMHEEVKLTYMLI